MHRKYKSKKNKELPSTAWINSLKKYGITEEIYDRFFEAQNGCCAICRKPSDYKRLAVDHDHLTGTVRGLLCQDCNLGLGLFKDNPESLLTAIIYLRPDLAEELLGSEQVLAQV
jgi:hypothetical protein